MIPVGSRFLLGAFGASAVVLIIYMSVDWGALGTVGLLVASMAFAFLAGINLYVRDSNVGVKDPTAVEQSPAARLAPLASIWPAIGALGAALVVIGLVTEPVVFIFGIVAMLAAVIEWMVEAWSERASADTTFNGTIRERMAHPYEFPVLAALITAVIVWSFSRIMLFLSKEGGPVMFGVLAALVLAIGAIVAARPSLRSSTVQSLATVAVLALVAGGVAASLAGPRDIEPHETLTDLAEHDECTAEETHADENASETVGAKSSILADIVLDGDQQLFARVSGIEGDQQQVFVARSNPTNVMFINESGEPARLVLDLGGTSTDEEATDATEPPAASDEGDGGLTQYCTALIEDGGSQFLTFTIGAASSEDNHYEFVVPGIDGQSVEVIVP
jgi:hypothetical protein